MYIPDHIRLSTNPDVLVSGAQRINSNFDEIAAGIESAIDGLAYQNPVITITNAAPTFGIELGSRYIVDFGVLEADPWYGHIDDIAELVNDNPYEWEFLAPEAGWCCTVLDEELEYLYNDEQWNQRPALISHNLLANIDGSTYHVSNDVYDALAGTGTPTSENKFVTADSLLTDISTHDHSGEISVQIDYGDLDNIPSTFTPASHSHSKTDITDFSHSHSKTDISDFAHASGHIKGTGDEIDGDKLDVDFNPSYYIPGTITEADNVDHLAAHLHGIDLAINTKSDTGHTHAYAAADHDSTHVTSGSDEIDGDKLDIDWDASNYTPATVTNFSDSADNLTSHLKGIDTAIGNKAASNHNHDLTYSALAHNHSGTYAPLTDSKVPTANLGSGTADSTTYLRGDQTWAILASGNNFVTVTAGEALSKYDIVYINTSDSNKAYKSKNNGTQLQSEVLGMVTETGGIAQNSTGQVIVNGTQTYNSWNWTPNKWLYLDSTSGALTQTLTTVNGQYAVPVAIALSATQIYIQPMTGWVVSNANNITLGFKSVSFNQASGTVAIVTPPANAIITNVTAVVSSAASGSGGTITVGTASSVDAVMASTSVDLMNLGTHTYDAYYSVGASPVQYNLTVTSGGNSFVGTLYFHYAVPNVYVGSGGMASISFNQGTTSPALIATLPANAVVTRCSVIVTQAASQSGASVSIGPTGTPASLMATTDSDLMNLGTYIYDPYTAQTGAVYATIVTGSQSFTGTIYLHYQVSN